MILFKVEGIGTFGYPESLKDIKAKTIIQYYEGLHGDTPPEIDELSALHSRARELEPKITAYEKKLNKTRVEIAKSISDGNESKKTSMYFPELYNEWTKVDERIKKLDKTTNTKTYQAKKLFPYIARVVSHFTGVPIEICWGSPGGSIELSSLLYIYDKIGAAINSEPVFDGKESVIIGGAEYHFPEKFMQKSTLIEFAEAAQFEEAQDRAANGDPAGLIDMAAVLLRKKGEPYTEEGYEERKALFMEQATMHDIWQVSFFLLRLSEKYAAAIQNYTLAATVRQIVN